MSRRSAVGPLQVCVVLLMFGTAAIAEDEIVFDLSPAPVPPAQEVPVERSSASLAQLEILGDADSEFVAPTSSIEVQPTPAVATSQSDFSVIEPGQEFIVEGQEVIVPGEVCPSEVPAPTGLFGWRRPATHFHLPSRSFSLFQSPASYGWGYAERCAPTPYKPRGNGIPRRTSCERMDYQPYALKHGASTHGPAFYQRHELYPCEECHLQRKHLEEYYGRRY